jgi:hypothetical protein
MRVSTVKTETMAFLSKNHIRRNSIENTITEEVSGCNYFGFNVSNCLKDNINIKLSKFSENMWNDKKNFDTKP